MKSVLLITLFFVNTLHAFDCPPLSLQGNGGWWNSNPNLPVSNLSSEFRGGNCKDQFYVTATRGPIGGANSYMMSHINESSYPFHYGFSLDFMNILDNLGYGKTVDVFELFVLPDIYTSPNIVDKKVFSISISKKKNQTDYNWVVSLVWYEPDFKSGDMLTSRTEYIILDGDVPEGVLHINAVWNSNNAIGSSVDVNVFSNIANSNNNQQTRMTADSTVALMTHFDGEITKSGLRRVDIAGDQFIKDVAPSIYHVGIINEDSGVLYPDGITFYTPWRD